MSTEGGHWRMPSSAAATVKPFVIAFVAVAAICMLSIPASSLHKNGVRMLTPNPTIILPTATHKSQAPSITLDPHDHRTVTNPNMTSPGSQLKLLTLTRGFG
uniref:Uncharacterized protein n=1 Tax=Lotharella globosa TaxID=91324 RepID=A0A7S3YSW2_9EUKA